MKKYLEIYEKIKDDIINEVYGFNEKLPSKRTIAEDMKVSVVTVETAYDILQSEGYIFSIERSGYFVSYNTDFTFKTNTKNEEKTEVFSVSKNNEYFPFSTLASATRKILSSFGEALLEKSANTGTEYLKKSIKNYLIRNRGISVEENQIIIGSGSEYLYGIITELLGQDKIYAIESPSYEQIEKVYLAKNVKIEKLPITSSGISSENLNKSIAQILHVTPYRSYPTLATATVSKKKEYLNWAIERNGFVIEDDYESEFSLTTKTTDTIFGSDKNAPVIFVNTFTKSICPALRVGYMLIPKFLTDTFYQKLGFYSCTVPTLEQYLIASILNDGSFERHVNKIRRLRRKQVFTT